MKRFSIGLIAGILIGLLASSAFVLADQSIKLIINGKEIICDVAPQMINNRTMVPARYVAEALGAKVEWDDAQNAVVITNESAMQENNTSVVSEPYEWISLRMLIDNYSMEQDANQNKFVLKNKSGMVLIGNVDTVNNTVTNSVLFDSNNQELGSIETQIRSSQTCFNATKLKKWGFIN